ncbi:hypothetical protein BH20ACT3_BH20ACT3_01260 [soil metagenome]
MESVRTVFTYLRDQLGEDVASAQLVITNGSAVLIRGDEELVDLVKQGQFVMGSILSLGGVQREVDDALVELFPDRAAADVEPGSDPAPAGRPAAEG